jgi:hypothetical protein
MDKIIEHLPAIITAAAQSFLGTFALLSVALSVLAYFFFAKAREKVKVGVFVLLFLGVLGFATAKALHADLPVPLINLVAGLPGNPELLTQRHHRLAL